MHPTPAETARSIGSRVRVARARAGLRQDELALAAGVSTRLVHTIEAGKATTRLDGLLRVLGALGLALDVVDRTPSGRG
ncbi:helix-turn-helix domain-containing protein [Gaiella occulta]|nr:helix-turn-helix domain-containing protein [Gaiella occulta]